MSSAATEEKKAEVPVEAPKLVRRTSTRTVVLEAEAKRQKALESSSSDESSDEDSGSEDDDPELCPTELEAMEPPQVRVVPPSLAETVTIANRAEVPYCGHFVWLFQAIINMKSVMPADLEQAILRPQSSPLMCELLSKLLIDDPRERARLRHGEGFPYVVCHQLLRHQFAELFEDSERMSERVGDDEAGFFPPRAAAKKGKTKTKSKEPDAADSTSGYDICWYFPSRVNPLAERDFHALPLADKCKVMMALCEYRLQRPDFAEHLREIDNQHLRVMPFGHDSKGNSYFAFGFADFRIYRQEPPKSATVAVGAKRKQPGGDGKEAAADDSGEEQGGEGEPSKKRIRTASGPAAAAAPTKPKKVSEPSFTLIVKTHEEYKKLRDQFKSSTDRSEKALTKRLTELLAELEDATEKQRKRDENFKRKEELRNADRKSSRRIKHINEQKAADSERKSEQAQPPARGKDPIKLKRLAVKYRQQVMGPGHLLDPARASQYAADKAAARAAEKERRAAAAAAEPQKMDTAEDKEGSSSSSGSDDSSSGSDNDE